MMRTNNNTLVRNVIVIKVGVPKGMNRIESNRIHHNLVRLNRMFIFVLILFNYSA